MMPIRIRTVRAATWAAAVLGLLAALPAPAAWKEALAAYQRGDFINAFTLTYPLAEKGDPLAQVQVGTMYLKGQGVAKDIAEGARWFRRAADQGHPLGLTRLAELYLRGRGVERDLAIAAALFRKAAEGGFAEAQLAIGTLFENGQGVPADPAEAARWYRKAAEQGNAGGQFNLGSLYSSGTGVPQDSLQAFAWYSLAAAQTGDDAIAGARDRAAARLSAEELQKGRSTIAELQLTISAVEARAAGPPKPP